ncbi:MAG: 2-amino-4-hydroxy-6-hydroxymethyldihydropteridine pyrophosphokinase, 2-amino-4-hydroxy-6-hydroxymethyldihydropteridine diphosphokinase [Candidatus Peregrinibacteria bacterium GW2011_GWF2_33_10]|nr:MAG: 2-amino-4-hydroxy-6-hydroxymethyldihydropteridine pyrophosphokinase, 2-amino-4-hydroxy-6-hydroxymethyldihydropteridine diphosphokinase [Candidatus Peregrinibacteria bacterium GW2011_GWF2_33_10]OGJ44789.1 MAG: 2-amino-4-hydroxy-6-hydroxymethyldihydropteridine diphosphokinase [Candidatus Peregrinibacteria bacterium RIFOXYA2_FULL_33_21]OGJ46551.1 MAG: 2-amino-4-hydroxy-6-hydroxymethyldihydropteridine diphosphokinase [Candidatus Peregrinibacteria bacterium RIFOXYA12_FULL_33_12]OGJ50475.1 MAG
MIYYLGLGTNLGDKELNLKNAIFELGKKAKILKKSSIYYSKPMGPKNQEDFLNMAVKIEADLEPLALLEFVKKLEKEMGRIKIKKWGPRIIDIDILFVEGKEKRKKKKEIFDGGEKLIIPHKGILEREFVLYPLEEIAPGLIAEFFNEKWEEIIKKAKYKVDLSQTKAII